jgi:hypothetical protein
VCAPPSSFLYSTPLPSRPPLPSPPACTLAFARPARDSAPPPPQGRPPCMTTYGRTGRDRLGQRLRYAIAGTTVVPSPSKALRPRRRQLLPPPPLRPAGGKRRPSRLAKEGGPRHRRFAQEGVGSGRCGHSAATSVGPPVAPLHWNETHLLCIMNAQCLQKICKAQNQCV